MFLSTRNKGFLKMRNERFLTMRNKFFDNEKSPPLFCNQLPFQFSTVRGTFPNWDEGTEGKRLLGIETISPKSLEILHPKKEEVEFCTVCDCTKKCQVAIFNSDMQLSHNSPNHSAISNLVCEAGLGVRAICHIFSKLRKNLHRDRKIDWFDQNVYIQRM